MAHPVDIVNCVCTPWCWSDVHVVCYFVRRALTDWPLIFIHLFRVSSAMFTVFGAVQAQTKARSARTRTRIECAHLVQTETRHDRMRASSNSHRKFCKRRFKRFLSLSFTTPDYNLRYSINGCMCSEYGALTKKSETMHGTPQCIASKSGLKWAQHWK